MSVSLEAVGGTQGHWSEVEFEVCQRQCVLVVSVSVSSVDSASFFPPMARVKSVSGAPGGDDNDQ